MPASQCSIRASLPSSIDTGSTPALSATTRRCGLQVPAPRVNGSASMEGTSWSTAIRRWRFSGASENERLTGAHDSSSMRAGQSTQNALKQLHFLPVRARKKTAQFAHQFIQHGHFGLRDLAYVLRLRPVAVKHGDG